MSAAAGSPTRNRIVVGVGDLQWSSDLDDLLVTFALGSCVGITAYDAERKVGGLLHAMLPQRKHSSQGEMKAAMFVDTGVPELFLKCYELGADKNRLVVCIVGGACRTSDNGGDPFKIGERNVEMVRALLDVNHVAVHAWDVGGTLARTLSLDMTKGVVSTRTGLEERCLA